LLPWLIGLIVLQLYPFFASLFFSFTNYSIVRDTSYVGFTNYIRTLTQDRTFWISLKATGIYVLFSVPLKLIFALFIATMLNLRVRGIHAFRMLYYLPSILGGSVGIAIMWRYLFNRHGYINLLLSGLGIGPVDFLGSTQLAIYTISMLSVWQFGSSMILFLSALKNVPYELMEAARIDGANKVQVFTKITFPMITPIVFFNIIMQTISAFQQFAAPYNITNGGPMKSTYLYGLMLYENAFSYLKMGYACAQSWILFIIILVFTGLMFKSSPYWAFYSDGGMF
jgi:oligogalacturonide transport system permease protein